MAFSKQLEGSRQDTTPAVPAPNSSRAEPEASTTPEKSHTHTHAHPISHPQESPEAYARIGLVPTDGVGPKKPKTSESQQPRPAVGPLLGVVRGVGGIEDSLESNAKPRMGADDTSLNQKPGDSLENSIIPEECQCRESSAKPGASLIMSLESSAKPEVGTDACLAQSPGCSMESSAKPEEWTCLESSAKPGASLNSGVGSPSSKLESVAKPDDSLPDAHAHPISLPQESPEAVARIGLVPTDRVGPKKPKISESHQPRPAVGPLLGGVRGVGGIEDSLESNAKPEEGPGIVSLAQKPGDSLESSAKSRNGPEARMGGMKPGDSLSSRAKHSDKYEEPKKQTLELHSVCSSRSGWKSSQAVTTSRVAGAVPTWRGGRGASTRRLALWGWQTHRAILYIKTWFVANMSYMKNVPS